MDERELLDLAAKAGGIECLRWNVTLAAYETSEGLWNPLRDDGDALRLAVRLDFSIEQNIAFHRSCALANVPGQKSLSATEFFEPWASDKQAATRRVIVCAAAEVGKQK